MPGIHKPKMNKATKHDAHVCPPVPPWPWLLLSFVLPGLIPRPVPPPVLLLAIYFCYTVLCTSCAVVQDALEMTLLQPYAGRPAGLANAKWCPNYYCMFMGCMSGCNDVVPCATPVMVWCTKVAMMRSTVSSHSRIHPSPGLRVPSGLGRMVVGVILLLLVLSGDVETNPGPVGESSGLL